MKKQIIKYLTIFTVCGLIYCGLEMLWRQYTDFSSFYMGGTAGIVIGLLNELYFTYEMPVQWQCFFGGIFITLMEYYVGTAINLDYHIWDYRNVPFNVDGQVSLPSSLLWCLLSILAIVIDDFIRWKFFGEEKPHYVFI